MFYKQRQQEQQRWRHVTHRQINDDNKNENNNKMLKVTKARLLQAYRYTRLFSKCDDI